MTLEVAFNFNNAFPEVKRFNNPPLEAFETRERFIAFITQGIDVLDVWNASCCIYTDGEEYTPPAWYMATNGKVFFEQLPEPKEPAFDWWFENVLCGQYCAEIEKNKEGMGHPSGLAFDEWKAQQMERHFGN